MKQLVSLFIVMFFLITACSKSIAPPVEEEVIIDNTPTIISPCPSFDDLSARDRDMAETAFVLYKDLYDLGKYDEAMPLWKQAYGMAPRSNGRVKYHYDHGAIMYSELFKQTSDTKLKDAYVDTVMMIYDKRIECFGDEAYVNGRKGYDYYYTYPSYATDMEKYQLFKKALDGKGKKADYFIVNPMTKLLYDNFQNGNIPLEEARDYAKKLTTAINYGTVNCGKSCAAWEIVNSYAPNRLEALEGVDGFYDCQYYADKYYQSYLDNPTDCETILLVSRRLFRGDCGADSPKLVELKNAYNTNCYTPPPPPGPLTQAFTLYNEGKFKEAVVKFDEYLDTTTESEKKAKYNLLVSKIYYRDLKNFSKSRSYALKAASEKSNWGEPYILIGKLYASSGPLCGPGTGWDSQIVTWPAIDKWEYAKNIDSSVASEANKLINQYKKYMPSKEDVFIRSLSEGSAFTVDCWINESTTIRTP